ncbi:MAG: TlpA family protein disulfide reductase, partial [Actinomycetota bacterium]|nr:TlpA family protein disulfide reductase [Actinomycetota bacterium]
MGAVVLVVFAGGLAAFALSGGPQSGSKDPTALKTAGPNDSSDGLGGEVTAVEEGNPFPTFSLTEADGRTLTNDSLEGKPSIVWFTTSYCIPCQQGAALVAKLDDELGGDAFDVLVVFVDPGEPTSALTDWRDRFANDDWMVALDDGTLSQKVGLRYLDSKFQLDAGGTIRNVDVVQADDNY